MLQELKAYCRSLEDKNQKFQKIYLTDYEWEEEKTIHVLYDCVHIQIKLLKGTPVSVAADITGKRVRDAKFGEQALEKITKFVEEESKYKTRLAVAGELKMVMDWDEIKWLFYRLSGAAILLYMMILFHLFSITVHYSEWYVLALYVPFLVGFGLLLQDGPAEIFIPSTTMMVLIVLGYPNIMHTEWMRFGCWIMVFGLLILVALLIQNAMKLKRFKKKGF